MNGITVIIPTYDNVEYIDECLDSIINNKSTENDIEILVGIDGCEKTKEYILNNINNYKNVIFYYFNTNVGTYIIKNTLVTYSKYDNILFFDSDDILLEGAIDDIIVGLKNSKLTQFKLKNFYEDINIKSLYEEKYSEGPIAIKKEVFLNFNGYYPWRTAADSELLFRYVNGKNKIHKINKVLFKRRVHHKSLMHNTKTGFNSEFLEKHRKMINDLKNNNFPNPDKLNITTNISIIGTHHNKNSVIDMSIIIPTFNNVQYIDECLTSIINNGINNINLEILVGIDACEKTKEYVINNKNKFKQTTFYYFNDNVGPYVIKNTLVNKTKSDKILFFDSDDILVKNSLLTIHQYLKKHEYIQFNFLNFENKGLIKTNIVKYAEGVFAIDKKIFNELNGFRPWRCAADSEFRFRYEYKRKKTEKINQITFHRRIHPTSLTRTPETGLKSEFRKNIENDIEKLKNQQFPNPEILHISNDYFEM